MEDSLAKASASHIFGGKARIVDRRLVRVNRCTGRVQDNDRLRYGIRNPPKFAFILTQFLLSLLEVFDVSAYAIPHGDLPSFVADCLKTNQATTKNPLMSAHARFDVTWFSGAQQFPPSFHERR